MIKKATALGALLVLTSLLTTSCCPLKAATAGEANPAPAPAPAPPPEALANTAFLEAYAATRGFRLGVPRAVRITPTGDAVLFLRSQARAFEQDLYAFDPATGEERVLLTAAQVLQGAEEHLSPEEKARRERMREQARGITSYDLSDDGTQILVPLSGRLFLVTRATGEVRELPSEAGGYPLDPGLSPDGTQLATVRDGDLYVTDLAQGAERRLTTRESPDISHGEAEFVAQEEMSRFHGYWWSPDSTHLAYQRTDTSKMARAHLADPSDPSKAPHAWPYPRPGGVNADVQLGVMPAAGGETVWVSWDRERYPYLATVDWSEGAPLTLLVQTRRQDEMVLLTADPATGQTSELLTERDQAWLNLDQTVPRWLADGGGFLWSTERSGQPALELRTADGALVADLTGPEVYYEGLLHVDEEAGVAWVAASGPSPEQHVWRVPLDPSTGPPTRLTGEPGLHGAVFSDESPVIVRYVDHPDDTRRRFVVQGADGAEVGPLRSVAEAPAFGVNLELRTVTIADREHDVAVIQPRNFDPGVTYPVILHVYAGPGHAVVRASGGRYLRDQWFADHGFVVVLLDGRGTPHRGRAWERTIRGNVIDAPLEDQAAGIEALGAELPELDLSRVGVFGWSFGGYFTAMATMRRPDLFKAGVAVAPVGDWMDYDTHYTERFLGLPEENAAGYRASSVLTYADGLDAQLLLLHGTVDDNVYFQHAVKISDALFRAGKDHGFVPLSGFTHMVADPLVTTRFYQRIMGWFTKHLGGPIRTGVMP